MNLLSFVTVTVTPVHDHLTISCTLGRKNKLQRIKFELRLDNYKILHGTNLDYWFFSPSISEFAIV